MSNVLADTSTYDHLIRLGDTSFSDQYEIGDLSRRIKFIKTKMMPLKEVGLEVEADDYPASRMSLHPLFDVVLPVDDSLSRRAEKRWLLAALRNPLVKALPEDDEPESLGIVGFTRDESDIDSDVPREAREMEALDSDTMTDTTEASTNIYPDWVNGLSFSSFSALGVSLLFVVFGYVQVGAPLALIGFCGLVVAGFVAEKVRNSSAIAR